MLESCFWTICHMHVLIERLRKPCKLKSDYGYTCMFFWGFYKGEQISWLLVCISRDQTLPKGALLGKNFPLEEQISCKSRPPLRIEEMKLGELLPLIIWRVIVVCQQFMRKCTHLSWSHYYLYQQFMSLTKQNYQLVHIEFSVTHTLA